MNKIKFWFITLCVSALIGYKFIYNASNDQPGKGSSSNLANNITKVVRDNIDKKASVISNDNSYAREVVIQEKEDDAPIFTSTMANISEETLKEVLVIKNDDILLGSSNAKVQMIQYSSFTCPACKYYQTHIFDKLKKEYINSGKVAYIAREFPFDAQAYQAAILARCGGKEKFYTFISVLFKNQEAWAYRKNYKELLTNIGQLGGIDAESFAKCVNNPEINQVILNNNIDATKRLKLGWAPVIFINGEQLDSEVSHSYELLSKKIDEYLDKSSD